MNDYANSAGFAYTANVSVTEAVVFNPDKDDPSDPNSWDILEADDFDKDAHGNCKFYCACCLDQQGELVRLKKPSGEYIQPVTFDLIDPETNEPIVDPETDAIVTDVRRYKIPARFTLFPGEAHRCDLGANQTDLSRTVRENGGTVLNSAAGAFIINLNIPAGQQSVNGRRARVPLSEMGEKFNAVTDGTSQSGLQGARRRIHRSSAARSDPKSHGINSVEGLARLLDHTEFDKGARAGFIARIDGDQTVTLAELFHDNTLDLYRDLFKQAYQDQSNPSANPNHLALFRFRPNGNRKFWTREEDGSMTVPSQPEQIIDKQGRKMFVSTKVNFQTEGAFDAFKAAYENGEKAEERSFLVYSEHGHVNLNDFRAQRRALDAGYIKHGNIAVETAVFNAAQMVQWSPRSPQLMLDFGDDPDAHPDDGMRL